MLRLSTIGSFFLMVALLELTSVRLSNCHPKYIDYPSQFGVSPNHIQHHSIQHDPMQYHDIQHHRIGHQTMLHHSEPHYMAANQHLLHNQPYSKHSHSRQKFMHEQHYPSQYASVPNYVQPHYNHPQVDQMRVQSHRSSNHKSSSALIAYAIRNAFVKGRSVSQFLPLIGGGKSKKDKKDNYKCKFGKGGGYGGC